jgi:hypothetical protein
MIVAVREAGVGRRAERLGEVQALKTRYQIDSQTLETLLRSWDGAERG